MSKLKTKRQQLNLTQTELASKSGLSVRTIQRIETGQEPKGHTLKVLAQALEIKENELLDIEVELKERNYTLIKLINLSSLPCCIFPPLNILVPLIILFATKHWNQLTKQIISLQIFWTIISLVIFMLSAFIKTWFMLGKEFVFIVMVLLILSDFFIILRNTASIDQQNKLAIHLKFNII